MKSMLFDHITRGSEHKYILLAAGALGIAYYISSYILTPETAKVYPEELQSVMTQANNNLFSKQYAQAITQYDQILAYDARCAAAHFNKGQALFHLERWSEACTSYETALACGMRPEHIHLVHFNYAIALFRLAHYDRSIEHATKALSYQQFAPAYAQRALALEALHQLNAAYADLKQACALAFAPEYAQALIKVGDGFRNENNFETAALCYRDAIAYAPENYNSYLSLGDVLHLQGKKTNNMHLVDEAMATYRKAIEYNESCHLAYHNLACMLLEREDELQAFAFLQKALACVPDHCATHLLLSCYYLQQGDFENGWREYEWRNVSDNPSRHEKNPLWNGSSSLTGKTVLLHAEQGFGDTFQFIRYAQLIKNCGPKKLIVEVQHALKKIAQLCPYIDEVITSNDAMPAYDLWSPLMSLPYRMKTKLETIPQHVPYLHADAQLTQFWRKRLSADHLLKIGICWQVNPHHDVTKYRNSNVTLSVSTPLRTIPLSTFETVAHISGTTLYSLQKEINTDDTLLAATLSIQQLGSDYDKSHGAFMDTAAIMKNLDLVITADTSIAHLAGGLGVPVWIILPYNAEWRWLKKRNDSPWYPTARLFRQKKAGDWAGVMEEVSTALKTIVR